MLDPGTGAIRWSAPSPDFTSAATRHTVVARRDDRIHALGTDDGAERWAKALDDLLASGAREELGISAAGRRVVVSVEPPSN